MSIFLCHLKISVVGPICIFPIGKNTLIASVAVLSRIHKNYISNAIAFNIFTNCNNGYNIPHKCAAFMNNKHGTPTLTAGNSDRNENRML